MTVATQTPYAQATGNGVATNFPFQYLVLVKADQSVYIDGVLKTVDVDYTIAGLGAPAGGSITFAVAPVNGAIVTQVRTMLRNRTIDYQQLGDFLAPVVNPDFDRAILLIQDMGAQLGRAIITPPSEVATLPTLPSKANRAGKYITFDANGQPQASAGTGNDSALRTDLANGTSGPGADLIAIKRTAAEIAKGVVPVVYTRQPGSILRYGADPTGVADSLAAINNALLCNPVVFDDFEDIALYKITGTMRYRAAGQILRGQGGADNNTAAGAGAKFAPRTTIIYAGAAGGKMLSNSDTAINLSETQLRDLVLDGNALANKGFEAYDGSIAGGCWRTVVEGVAITNVTNVTGGTPIALDLGAGTGNNNCNDPNISALYIYNTAIGMRTGGATGPLTRVTFKSCTTAGASISTGGHFTPLQCVFSTNTWDILATDPQLVSPVQCWFENSVQGIYKPTTSHKFHAFGCLLHTANATRLIDLNNAAGNWSIVGCPVNPTTASYLLANINGSYEYSVLGSDVIVQAGYRFRTLGAVRADNAAFAAGLTGDAANATGDGTAVSLNASAFTENYDLSSVFAAASGVYTAPVFGYYEFTVHVELSNVAAAHTDAILNLVTTGQTYLLDRVNPGAVKIAGNEVHLNGRVVVPMNSTDTAYVQVTLSGSTKTVTINSGGAGTNWRTRFEGRLV